MAGVVTQTGVQAATAGQGVPAVTQFGALAAYAPPAAQAVQSSQFALQAATVGQGVPAVSQSAVLVAYRTGATEDLTTRAWTFTLDGHEFYAVTLGEQGTWVYDRSTQQWAQWQTDGYSSWNMEVGTTWRGMVIAGDRDNPVIWLLNPGSHIDNDFKPQTRKVTGGLSVRNRTFISVYAFRLTASLGVPDVPITAPATLPTVRLRYSDDQGKTYIDAGELTLEEGNNTQELAWLSLGQMQAPGRVFEITDVGAVVRINGADAEHDEE